MITNEQKQKAITKFSDDSPCMCFNLRKASRAITQIYDDMFRCMGLRATQAAILTTARMLGPLTITQMAEAMSTDRTTLTRNLKPLQRDGYITIEPGQDRREREVIITPKGKEISIKTFAIWEKFQTEVNKSLGKTRLEKLCKDLSTVVCDIQKI